MRATTGTSGHYCPDTPAPRPSLPIMRRRSGGRGKSGAGRVAAVAALVAALVEAGESRATRVSYTDSGSFEADLPAAAQRIGFDGLASGTALPSGSATGGIAFTYAFSDGAGGPLDLLVSDRFEAPSPNHALGVGGAALRSREGRLRRLQLGRLRRQREPLRDARGLPVRVSSRRLRTAHRCASLRRCDSALRLRHRHWGVCPVRLRRLRRQRQQLRHTRGLRRLVRAL